MSDQNHFVFYDGDEPVVPTDTDVVEVTTGKGFPSFRFLRNGKPLRNINGQGSVTLPISDEELSITTMCGLFLGGARCNISGRKEENKYLFQVIPIKS